MTDTIVEKNITLDESICYVLGKCCSIEGYAYRLGYIDPKKSQISQIVYKKKIKLPNRYYAEISVQSGAWENPLKEKCRTKITIFSPDGKELGYSEPQDEFTGIHQLEVDNTNYILIITC